MIDTEEKRVSSFLREAADAFHDAIDTAPHERVGTGGTRLKGFLVFVGMLTVIVFALLLAFSGCGPIKPPAAFPAHRDACIGDTGYHSPMCPGYSIGGRSCVVCEKATACYDYSQGAGIYCIDKSVGGGGCFECDGPDGAHRVLDGGVK